MNFEQFREQFDSIRASIDKEEIYEWLEDFEARKQAEAAEKMAETIVANDIVAFSITTPINFDVVSQTASKYQTAA